ncbi:hypothetical protein [Taklimakanibacter albus]|uniref:Uncharacterized protein n=1 Tax=Taklimakanibacter albus TaxID=2800327 RepID=A0ACC5RGA3_9HYPH|nr:hypothetical protein [Aestuariivirga sp. YIM B02566]MBK1871551.1 hypothetical protein [Aestuariivirga sp. YIM B02566]
MSDRFVVRYNGPSAAKASDWWFDLVRDSPSFYKDKPEATFLADKKEAHDECLARDGEYVALGGGHTRELSEANVVGWTTKSKKRWTEGHTYGGGKQCPHSDYELVPVEIVIKEPTNA